MAFFIGPNVVVGDPTSVHDSAKNKLGARAFDEDGNEYIYLSGVASTVKGSWVTFDEAHITTLTVANAKGRVAIAGAAVVAAKFGWYGIGGKIAGKVLAAFADNGIIFLTATAGSVDDTAVAGDLVHGAMGRAAIDTPETGLAWCELNNPFVDDATET